MSIPKVMDLGIGVILDSGSHPIKLSIVNKFREETNSDIPVISSRL